MKPRQRLANLSSFFRRRRSSQKLGARIPRGVLLLGPPGCGKTLPGPRDRGRSRRTVPFHLGFRLYGDVRGCRARAEYGTCSNRRNEKSRASFFLMRSIRSGRKRGLGLVAGGSHGEREQTLNAILSEMDGFEPHDQVIVIAATNRPDVLDPALVRPRRFDRRVTVPLPGHQGPSRHPEGAYEGGQAFRRRRPGKAGPARLRCSPAPTCVRWSTRAAIIAAMADQNCVSMNDMRRGRDKLKFGRAQTSREIDEQQRTISAYHEAGHALVESLLEDADPVEKVTIVPRGHALGATFSMPQRERYGYGRKYLLATLRVLCGGRVAELRKTGDASSGAEDDIKKVTQLAERMVRVWGMSDEIGIHSGHGRLGRRTVARRPRLFQKRPQKTSTTRFANLSKRHTAMPKS